MNLARRAASYLRDRVQWRRVFAYGMMSLFVVLPTIGASMIYPPAGWVVAGLLCGAVGYLLGAD